MSTAERHAYWTHSFDVPEFLHRLGITPEMGTLHAAHPVSEGGRIVRVVVVTEDPVVATQETK